MARVAIAITEPRAHAIHEELLKDDPSEGFTSIASVCQRCSTVFIIFFVNGGDPNNSTYATTLRERIAESCEHGRHTFDALPLSRS